MSSFSSRNNNSNSLYSLELEADFLSGVIRCPDALADLPFITGQDFSPTNRVIFTTIKACMASEKEFNKFVLIEKLNSLSIKVQGEIAPGDYVGALELRGVSEKAIEGIGKELKRWTVKRLLFEMGKKIQEVATKDETNKDGSFKKVGELVADATGIFNNQVNILSGVQEKEPIALYGSIRKFLDREVMTTEKAIIPPFKIFADLYGYWDVGSAPHVFCSRMKIGKSSLWLSSMLEIAKADMNDTFRVLVLDTELSEWENQSRSIASVTGLEEFYIRQGWYKNNKTAKKKVEEAIELLEPLGARVSHIFCGNMELEEIVSVTRRWAHKNLTEGKRGMVVYDYIKLNSQSDFSGKNSLFMTFGAKIDAFKNLAKELNVACICFAQTNRENVDSKQGDKQQSSAVVGGSDMIAQFASNVYLLEELTPDERVMMNQMVPGGATHSLKEIACRQRGPCELGEHKAAKYKDKNGKDRYQKNYILLNFDHFNVREVGTFKQIMEKNQMIGINVQNSQATPQGQML